MERGNGGGEGGYSILFVFYCTVQKAALVGRVAGDYHFRFWSASGYAFAGMMYAIN